MPLLRTLLVLCLVTGGLACDIKVNKNGDVSVDVASGKASDEWRRTYSLPKGGRLDIINVNGVIEVFPANGPHIEVVARREVRTRTDEEAKARLAKAEMIEDVGPDHVKIEAKSNDQGVSFGPHGRINIQYRVTVPAGLVTSFRTENGAVRLENIDGRITLASTNGPIVGRGLSGSVDASTVNGGIEIGLTSVTGDSKIVTVNGPATLILSPEIDAELEAAAVNGGVTTQDGLPLTASDRTNKRVVGRLNDGGPRISVQTTNGGVRVGVTGDFARGRRGGGRRGEAGG
jgi:bifunctional DNA-binding transcriptional regulator/antitoxin component of YhaV-PrlF toxin-antitoxin module